MSVPARLSPTQLLGLWHETFGCGEARIVAFGNRITDYYHATNQDTRIPLGRIPLPTRIRNALLRGGIRYADELSSLPDSHLLGIKEIGHLSIPIIRQALSSHAAKPPSS